MSIGKFTATNYDLTQFAAANNFIAGKWVVPSGTETMNVVNPRHGKVMSSVRFSTPADLDTAVTSAIAAQVAWRLVPMRDRAAVLYRVREIMARDIDELAWLLSHENGKLFDEAKAEIAKSIECLEYGCSLPNLAAGENLEVSRGVTCETTYEPLGVVAGIVPFNFPMMVPLWMLPQAIVAGNAFILKPSERVPLSTLRLAEICKEAGLPDGILSLVQGGKAIVEAICDHPGIKAVGFVGSTTIAKTVYARASAHGKRALCLGGAKNHLIVVPDADVALTAENVVASFAGCAGQRCMAASVLLAVGDVDHIVAAIVEKAKTVAIGVGVGPVITAAAAERIVNYIGGAEKAGGKILLDGRGQRATPDGNWVGLTVLDNMQPTMAAACEEIFGPVLSIVRVPSVDAAIKIENANPYGNASSVYTTSGHVAREVMSRVSAGMCGVNVGVPVPREPFAFGGWNDSRFGHGDMTGWDGFRFWTQTRKVTTKWALQKDTTWMG